MATITHGGTLPDSANKTDFYSIIDNGTVTGIVNADIASGAAITDGKLAQITTAGKVSGAALTSLSSTPSGAGALPTANLPTGIPYSKLTLTGAVLSSDLAGSIADTKLSTISTAGKVSGAALTSLSSIPGGAGVIPLANLPSFGLLLVSVTTFTADTSKTISGLTTDTPYLLVLNLTAISNNEDLVIFPNGTLSTIAVSTNYNGGSNKMRLHNSDGFNPSGTTGTWDIKIRSIQGDTTKTAFLVDGCDTNSTIRHAAYSIMDSDTALSSITIGGWAGTMTLTGTAYLYKYATS